MFLYQELEYVPVLCRKETISMRYTWYNYAFDYGEYYSQDEIPTGNFPPGHSYYIGTSGADVHTGDDGNNTIFGQRGNDVLDGGGGNDTIAGGGGFNTIEGGSGKDYLFGGNHGNLLSGGYDNDMIFGGDGFDKLNGDWGHDQLWAGKGNDTLYGGVGNDTIRGGEGADVLRDDVGADVFMFDTPLGNGNIDKIEGFKTYLATGADRIGLSKSTFLGLHGDSGDTLRKNEFHIGAEAKGKYAQIVYDKSTGVLAFDADGKGGDAAVVFAQVDPNTTISNRDFLLSF
jgi:serralysin